MTSEHRRLALMPYLIFSSRWLQLPLYLGLIVAQAIYVVQFVRELWHLIETSLFNGGIDAKVVDQSAETTIMLTVLGLIDVVMISNLLVMVIVGGYETFVSRLRLEGHPDQPEWLSHVNATVLKVKLAMAIIGISSIHLLKTFIASGALTGLPFCTPEQFAMFMDPSTPTPQCSTLTPTGVMWQAIIHAIFILSAIGIAWTDRIMYAAGARAKPAMEH